MIITTPPASSCPAAWAGRHGEVCREIFENQNLPMHLIEALVKPSLKEIQGIKESYQAIYGEELLTRLLSIMAANPECEQLCYGLWLWMMDPPERDAAMAKDAIKPGGIEDYNALVEFYIARKPSRLSLSKQAYFVKFRRHLDNDILDPAHAGSKILAALAASHKSHHDRVSKHIGNCDAKRLNEALKATGGVTDGGSSTVIEMFSKRSIPQMKLAFARYRHIYGHDYIEISEILLQAKPYRDEEIPLLPRKLLQERPWDLAQGELEIRPGEFEESLKVVIQCMCAPYTYYSEMIHMSLMAETDKKKILTRVMIGSVEAGMNETKNAYKMKYNVKLEDAIAERVHDDDMYRRFLLALSNATGLN